jgi:cytochrome c peroxidase
MKDRMTMTKLALACMPFLTLGCSLQDGDFTDEEWSNIVTLANLPDPPPDKSNMYVGNPKVIALGKKFYFDPDFSGEAAHVDMLNRPTFVSRADSGKPLNISCNTCHQLDSAGADHSSVPRNVGVGSGPMDVNGQQTMNSAYYALSFWNGRSDSLWSQAMSVAENNNSMASDRLKVVWRIADAYRDEYNAAFADWPLPALMDRVALQKSRLMPDGSCIVLDGACPTWCEQVAVATTTWCLPRFPLRGKPGYEDQVGLFDEQTSRRCQRGQVPSVLTRPEPFDDAFDCMNATDQQAVTRIYTNWAKALAAYQYTLISRDASFDRWVSKGEESNEISASAKRGAKLFVGKAACVDCHSGPLFSDDKFHNIGVPQSGDFVPTVNDCRAGGWCDCVSGDSDRLRNCMPNGARDGLRRLQFSPTRRDSEYSDDMQCRNAASMSNRDACDGRIKFYSALETGGVFNGASLIGKWRTPSLRDVEMTAPYMHTGAYETLEAVIAHYNSGGSSGRGSIVGTQEARIAPLELSKDDVIDLVEFLGTLNGARLPEAVTATPTLPALSPF